MHLQSDSFKEMFDVSLMHLMNKETMFMSCHRSRSTFKEENDFAPYLYPRRDKELEKIIIISNVIILDVRKKNVQTFFRYSNVNPNWLKGSM